MFLPTHGEIYETQWDQVAKVVVWRDFWQIQSDHTWQLWGSLVGEQRGATSDFFAEQLAVSKGNTTDGD